MPCRRANADTLSLLQQSTEAARTHVAGGLDLSHRRLNYYALAHDVRLLDVGASPPDTKCLVERSST
jgi:hypothetical protein